MISPYKFPEETHFNYNFLYQGADITIHLIFGLTKEFVLEIARDCLLLRSWVDLDI